MSEVDPRLPAAIHDLWSALKSEVVWLHGRWIIYLQLYGTSAERIDLLNRSGSTFFYILQMTLLHDVQLSLSKLDDPAGSGTRKNMTLDALVEQLGDVGEAAVAAEIKPLVAAYHASCVKLRQRRNKSIAHYDLNTMLAAKVTPIEGPSRAEIETALEALREVMNHVELHYTQSQTAYEHFIMTHDGDQVIEVLKRGLRYGEMVQEGVIGFEDLIKTSKRGA
jgi:HEPN superfamily AbiU2-like protein